MGKTCKKIYLVAEVDEVLKLRDDGVVDICMGEVDGIRPLGILYTKIFYELCIRN